MSGLLKSFQPKEPLHLVTKHQAIDAGLDFLHGAGSDHICKVCIPSGGSCCVGCSFLSNGVGCQQRNTSCTAWLCGFLKYIFYEAGLLTEWEKFWDQVPGQQFREDETPPSFLVDSMLESPNIRFLSEAFANDLQEHIANNPSFWVLEIKETLDRYVDMLMDYTDPEIKRKIEKKLRYALKDFKNLQLALEML